MPTFGHTWHGYTARRGNTSMVLRTKPLDYSRVPEMAVGDVGTKQRKRKKTETCQTKRNNLRAPDKRLHEAQYSENTIFTQYCYCCFENNKQRKALAASQDANCLGPSARSHTTARGAPNQTWGKRSIWAHNRSERRRPKCGKEPTGVKRSMRLAGHVACMGVRWKPWREEETRKASKMEG